STLDAYMKSAGMILEDLDAEETVKQLAREVLKAYEVQKEAGFKKNAGLLGEQLLFPHALIEVWGNAPGAVMP
ncbi:MAG: hypothetical protein AAFQ08_01480, partial [Bacteroidota bacterium]